LVGGVRRVQRRKRRNQADIFEDPNTGDTIHLNFGTPTMTVTFRDVRNVKSLERRPCSRTDGSAELAAQQD
ncbi:MAG TPA: hypothetical protein VG497_18455, partial [Kribbella sp.]|nr:hypothetical protein [Kribbella sp.]